MSASSVSVKGDLPISLYCPHHRTIMLHKGCSQFWIQPIQDMNGIS
jgi:hypothetical protein